jgi:hypothetical protein
MDKSLNPPTQDEWLNLQIAYANAMWAWAQIETQIFAIFAAATGGLKGDLRPLRAAFFALVSFEGRLTQTHAAMKERWGNPRHQHFDIWSKLYERCKTAQRQRGSIAHLSGYRVDPQKPHQKPLFVLVEPFWHHRHPPTWGEAKSRGTDSQKLRQYAHEWHKLMFDLDRFGNTLWAEAMLSQALPQASPSQAGDQGLPIRSENLHDTGDQNHKESEEPR